MEMWMSLPRGQRRATIVLLALVLLLCGAQVVASMWRTHNNEATADYTMLEQEIEQFRSQLDTMSLRNARKSIGGVHMHAPTHRKQPKKPCSAQTKK